MTYSSTLNGAITADSTDVFVAAAPTAPYPPFVQVGSELMAVVSVQSPARYPVLSGSRIRIAVQRGALGTTRATHTDGAAIYAVTPVVQTSGPTAPPASDVGAAAAIFYSESDPGAVGPGAIWVNTTQDADENLSNFPMYVRNEADDGWIATLGDAVGGIFVSAYSADSTKSAKLQLGGTGADAALRVSGPGGLTRVDLSDNDGAPLVVVRVGGTDRIFVSPAGISFSDQLAPTIPVLPATPTAQDIAAALVALGLVTQTA